MCVCVFFQIFKLGFFRRKQTVKLICWPCGHTAEGCVLCIGMSVAAVFSLCTSLMVRFGLLGWGGGWGVLGTSPLSVCPSWSVICPCAVWPCAPSGQHVLFDICLFAGGGMGEGGLMVVVVVGGCPYGASTPHPLWSISPSVTQTHMCAHISCSSPDAWNLCFRMKEHFWEKMCLELQKTCHRVIACRLHKWKSEMEILCSLQLSPIPTGNNSQWPLNVFGRVHLHYSSEDVFKRLVHLKLILVHLTHWRFFFWVK